MAAQPLPLEIASPGFRQMDLKQAQKEAHAQKEALWLIRESCAQVGVSFGFREVQS